MSTRKEESGTRSRRKQQTTTTISQQNSTPPPRAGVKHILDRMPGPKFGILPRILRRRNGRLGVVLTIFVMLLFIFLIKRNTTNYEILSALGSRNGTELVKPSEKTTIFQPVKKCESNGRDKLAIFLVTTLPANVERRNSIRETWAKWSSDYPVMVYFFTGRPKDHNLMQGLEDEFYLHGDLIIEDLKENYHALTIKTLRMLKWFLNHCPEAKYLVKVDDDVFVNIPVILPHLEKISKSNAEYRNYIGGQVHRGREPHDVNPFSKWYIPSAIWPSGETLPPYTGGPCYVLSSKVVPLLYNKGLVTPLINLEDVFLVGMVGYLRLGIEPQEIPNLYDAHYPRLNFRLATDDFIKTSTAYHTDGDIGLMRLLYNSVTT